MMQLSDEKNRVQIAWSAGLIRFARSFGCHYQIIAPTTHVMESLTTRCGSLTDGRVRKTQEEAFSSPEKLFQHLKIKLLLVLCSLRDFLLLNVWQISCRQLKQYRAQFLIAPTFETFFRKQLKFSRVAKHVDGEKKAPKKFEWEFRVCRKCSWCKQLCGRGHNHQTWFLCTQSLWATTKAGSSRNMKRLRNLFAIF